MVRAIVVLCILLSFESAGWATPYWVAWEGDDWPESVGYERNWGDLQGQYHGSGAVRTLQDGVLTYDSLYDPGVCDFYVTQPAPSLYPGAGEVFVMEWRLKVDVVNGPWDPGIGLFTEDSWGLGFSYAYDHIVSHYEGLLSIPIGAGVWHDYRVVSHDMRSYQLFADDLLLHDGYFAHLVGPSEVGWGDGCQSAASIHHWDFFRFGIIVPEPAGIVLLAWVTVWCVARRSMRI